MIQRIGIIISICFLFTYTTKIKNNKIKDLILLISTYSFSIYLFHEMNLTILKKIATKILPNTPIFQLIQYLIIPLIVFVGCLFISDILKKKCSPIYKMITGNRKR